MVKVLSFFLASLSLVAQPPAPDAGAPVIVDGKEVMRIKAAFGPYSPEVRAVAARERIIHLGESGPAKPLDIEIRQESGIKTIYASGEFIVAVTEADAKAEGVTIDELTKRRSNAIVGAVYTFRQMHSLPQLLLNVLKAIVAWLVFFGLCYLLKRAFMWVTNRLEHWFSKNSQTSGGARGFIVLLRERLLLLALLLTKFATGVFLLIQLSVLLTYTFSLFPATQGISVSVLDTIISSLSSIGGAIVDYLPRGIFVLVVVAIAYYILRVAKVLFQAIQRGEVQITSLPADMAMMTYQLARAGLIVFVLIIVFPYLPGSQSEAFKGISIFLGILFSLGSGSAISNVLAGVVLTYMRPYSIGDRVKIADQMGDVMEKGVLVTRLKTIKNVEVTIPNASILGTQILNFSAMAVKQGLILNTTVTIGYDAPWRTVHQIMIDAAKATEGILADPPPFVLQTSLNDFHISYEINAYTDRPNEMINIYSRLHANIQESFNKSGVEIMSPTFLALRDGNTVTTPEAHRPGDYIPPSFRVKQGD